MDIPIPGFIGLNVTEFLATPKGTAGELAAFAVIVAILWLVGVSGNICVLIIYIRKGLLTSSSVFIFALAWTDLLTTLVWFPVLVIYMYGALSHIVLIIMTSFAHLSFIASIVILVVIAVDRYYCVVKPLKFAFNVHVAHRCIGVAFLIVIISNSILLPLHWLAYPWYITVSGILFLICIGIVCFCYICVFISVYKRNKDKLLKTRNKVVPDIKGVTLTNDTEITMTISQTVPAGKVRTINRVEVAKNTGKRMTNVNNLASGNSATTKLQNTAKGSIKIARMLLIVTTVFVVFYIPYFAQRMFPDIGEFVASIYIISSVANPLIYSVSTTFRVDFVNYVISPCQSICSRSG